MLSPCCSIKDSIISGIVLIMVLNFRSIREGRKLDLSLYPGVTSRHDALHGPLDLSGGIPLGRSRNIDLRAPAHESLKFILGCCRDIWHLRGV